MVKFKNGDDVVILGESIGGFDFKGEKGVIINHILYGHYKIKVGDKAITYTENKLDFYKGKIDEQQSKKMIDSVVNELEKFNKENLINYFLDMRDFNSLKLTIETQSK